MKLFNIVMTQQLILAKYPPLIWIYIPTAPLNAWLRLIFYDLFKAGPLVRVLALPNFLVSEWLRCFTLLHMTQSLVPHWLYTAALNMLVTQL